MLRIFRFGISDRLQASNPLLSTNCLDLETHKSYSLKKGVAVMIKAIFNSALIEYFFLLLFFIN